PPSPHRRDLTPPLLLQPYRARPGLHSFPTRRSSDLLRTSYHQLATHQRKFWYWTTYMENLDVKFLRSPAVVDYHSELPETGKTGDRKSTRLNSSHVSISYAVFCLKKKKSMHQHYSLV